MSEKTRRGKYDKIASAIVGIDIFVAPAIVTEEALDFDEERCLNRLAWLLVQALDEANKLKHGGWDRCQS